MAKPASGYGQREWEKRKNRCSNNERLGCVMEVNGIKRTGKERYALGTLGTCQLISHNHVRC